MKLRHKHLPHFYRPRSRGTSTICSDAGNVIADVTEPVVANYRPIWVTPDAARIMGSLKRPPLYTLMEWIQFRIWFARLYRVDLRGRERIPETGPVILCSNHESMIDPWLLGLATLRPIRYMAKAEFFRMRLLRPVMEAYGTFPVERGTGDRNAVGRGRQLLRGGPGARHLPAGDLPAVPAAAVAARRREARARRRRDDRPRLHRRQRAGAPARQVQAGAAAHPDPRRRADPGRAGAADRGRREVADPPDRARGGRAARAVRAAGARLVPGRASPPSYGSVETTTVPAR